MKPEWVADKEWADQYVPEATAILRRNAIKLLRVDLASEQMDMKQAVDLVITTDVGQIAWRVRRQDCRHRDLTLRFRRRPWGNPRVGWKRGYEVDKIIGGYATHYLYSWVV